MDDRGVLLCRGVPGMPELSIPDGKHPYPDTVTDVVKLLRERGLDVAYEDPRDERALVAHRAADIWIPIIQVTSSFLVSISGGLFTAVILDLLGMTKSQERILHVEFRVIDEKGSVRKFKADGTGGEVLRALRAFEGEFNNEQGVGDSQAWPEIDSKGAQDHGD